MCGLVMAHQPHAPLYNLFTNNSPVNNNSRFDYSQSLQASVGKMSVRSAFSASSILRLDTALQYCQLARPRLVSSHDICSSRALRQIPIFRISLSSNRSFSRSIYQFGENKPDITKKNQEISKSSEDSVFEDAVKSVKRPMAPETSAASEDEETVVIKVQKGVSKKNPLGVCLC